MTKQELMEELRSQLLYIYSMPDYPNLDSAEMVLDFIEFHLGELPYKSEEQYCGAV